jgi:hypothetical protein
MTALVPTGIILNEEAPLGMVRLVAEAMKLSENVKTVIFDAFVKELGGDLGAFVPETGTIIIDMGACMTNISWTKRGILYISNVWINLLTAFYHELGHAEQLAEEPDLLQLDTLPEEYEEEATEIAIDMATDWMAKHPVPPLMEMGWVGQEIRKMFNKLYAQMPETVEWELALQGCDIGGNAETIAKMAGESEGAVQGLLKQIDEGDIGDMVGGKKWISAGAAVTLITDRR